MRCEQSTCPNETWRAIPGLDGYEVSDLGRVRSIDRISRRSDLVVHLKGRPISSHRNADGYWRSRVGDRMYFVHSLVLLAFVGPRPDGMQACHGNGDPSDCRLANLRWDTPKGNALDRLRHGTYQFGERNPRAKLSAEQVCEIRATAVQGGYLDIANRYGITPDYVGSIVARRRWNHV